MNQKSIFTAFIFLISLISNAQNWMGNGDKIKGNGKIVTINRIISEYDEINVGGSFDVLLVRGKEGNIKIEGEENIVPLIETTLTGNTLQIKFKKNTNIYTTKKLIVTVPITTISKISLGGSGNISNEGVFKSNDLSVSLGGSGNIKLQIDTNELNANIGGSGNIDLSGKTTEFNSSIAGSGNISAYELISKNSTATIAGSGSIKTTTTSKIKAKVVGSGNIYYKGTPSETDLKSVGSGEIINKN
ncbi:MAG: DUF2807 domain-containing protein [Flavobacteriia bacterium]|nr:DUF2807 domain-containing protein [Flavobacteriia bacterium]OIP46850.1 MAG: hypothetical protein AUK46_07345 [Flavobacteriaceae bacterium CG2_30_31_66]PIV96340.1 MAG: DUF2807 domain-containing protein [Flavobacteriaceae bacterium CG17_big_fil_post_rev_8_21_14_2_50_31_13]PIX14795.1 MAG: DUF2807 domain-containing protein [Flavobacteriaceae bacterium CG_4_8_14_3_um_filter_31_8]PIY15537.1 MAG: DUF2807 domain-containing protein [Flavobacteriaceae bacterium CG_4_10_14_3_um_filter_31_253]PIZ11721.